jgi:farnesyl diphosphate synthase
MSRQDEFLARLAECAARTERMLDALLPTGAGAENIICDAMRHTALGGGKRLRAFLAAESAALFGADPTQADRVAAAIECLHAYSLVHDDLPCMDDDDTRRGRPTVHVKWDEATAVLVGDGLQSLAFEILTDPATHADPERRAELALGLARASGARGMVAGQALDIAAESASAALTLDEITRLQALKTGALIEFACISGAILGGASDDQMRALADYASDLGLAFQIRDDVLDVEGDAKAAGKKLRKDADAGKATFVSLLGLEEAKRRADELADAAAAHLAPFGDFAWPLAEAARFSVSRQT